MAALAAGAVIGVFLAVLSLALRSEPAAQPPAATDGDSTIELAAALPPRPVYKYSVVNGGAYTANELAHAIARDAVVASHYRTVDVRQVRAETVAADRFAYMSYRRGDQIFWTKHKVRLRQGETVLTDGTTQIRARCGNCISLEPMLPVAEDEPEMVEFEALMDDPPIVAIGQPPAILPPALLLPPPFGTAPIDLPWGAGPIPIAGNFTDPGPVDELIPESPRAFDTPGLGDPGPVVVPLPSPPVPPGGGGSNAGTPPGGDPPPVLVKLPPPVQPPIELPPDFTLEEDPPLDPEQPTPVPEPGTLLLTGGGLALVVRRLRSKR